jgi:hypothetical protein
MDTDQKQLNFIRVHLRLSAAKQLALAAIPSRFALFASDLPASSWLGHSELLSC